jgi:hypothetical protein
MSVRLVRVFSPAMDGDVLAIVTLLEAREVPCFVHSTRGFTLPPERRRRDATPRDNFAAAAVPEAVRSALLMVEGEMRARSAKISTHRTNERGDTA